MAVQEQYAETVHKVSIPTHHFTLLVAPSGEFLCCDDEGRLGLTAHGDDSILWNQHSASGEFQHEATGTVISTSADAGGQLTLDLHRTPNLIIQGGIEIDETLFTKEHGPGERPSISLKHLEEFGWVCLTNILSDDIVRELERTAGTDRFAHVKYDVSQPAICQNPAVAITAAEPVSLWIIRQYMQIPDVKLGHTPAFAVLRKDDGERNVQGWHSDFPYHWGTGARGQVPTPSGKTRLGVQRNVCVSEFSKIRGATAFKLGSHAREEPPPESWGTALTHARPGYRKEHGLPYNGPDADIVEAPGGSIILYDSRTWHRAGVNRSDHPRAAMLQAMLPMYVLPKNDTSQSYRQFLESPMPDQLNDRVKNEVRNLMVHQFIGPGGRYVISPDEELSSIVRDSSRAY